MMKKISEWWKQDKRYLTFVKAVLLALLPVLCCGVKCATDGRTIGDVWLPNCEWNDELFYFKQVEGIIQHGYPLGYFGFNESHALKLSFAAWSPVLVFPWILWGMVFGWNFLSPILCNLFVLCAVFYAFVWLVKPTWKQVGLIGLLLCLYTPMWRYALSSMPEVICMSMVILFYAVAWNYLKRKSSAKLLLLFVMSGVMTLMRPYLLLFMLLPAWFWVREKGWKGLFGSAFCIATVFGIYVCINHYLGAAYFAPLFFTDWLEAFGTRGIFGGIYTTFGKLYRMGKEFLAYTLEGTRSGLYAGTYFGVFLVMLMILLYQCVSQFFRRKYGDEKIKEAEPVVVIQGHLLFSFVAMLTAVLLMYKLTEGSRHLLTFMAAGIFVIGMMETRYFKKTVFLGVTLAYLLNHMAVDPIVYQIPYMQSERKEQLEYWQNIFEENLRVDQERAPDFKNNIIWVTTDYNENGEVRSVCWQMLYGIPKGFGISCCKPEYCMENLDKLQSHYIATLRNGNLDRKLRESGYISIGSDEELIVYDLFEQTE